MIKPADVEKHIYKRCTVEMTVRSSRMLRNQELCFLNSKKNFRDEGNFVVVLRSSAIDDLEEKKIDDPARHFLNKKVRVTGRVELYEMKPQIVVEKLDQIKIVKKSKSGELYEVKAEDTSEDDAAEDEADQDDDQDDDEGDGKDANGNDQR